MAPGYVFEYRFNAQGQPEAVWASEGVEAVLGCTLDEVERRGGWDALIDEAWKPLARARQERLLEGEPQSGELRIRSIAGDRKWIEINLQPVLDPGTGAVTGIVGSAYDITTRKVAEEALRKSEAVLRAVTENTPDWLFLLDESLNVRFMNRPFGPNRPETVLGKCFLDFIPQDLRPGMEEIYGRRWPPAFPPGSSCVNRVRTARPATSSTGSCRLSRAAQSALSRSPSPTSPSVSVSRASYGRRAAFSRRCGRASCSSIPTATPSGSRIRLSTGCSVTPPRSSWGAQSSRCSACSPCNADVWRALCATAPRPAKPFRWNSSARARTVHVSWRPAL